jgi:hypothetical protein
MSIKNPVIAITGSSGAGTTSVTKAFQHIFRREQAQRGDHRGRQLSSLRPSRQCAHRWPRRALAGDHHFSHFGPEANLLAELENCSANTVRAAAARAATTCTTKPKPSAMARTGNLHRMERSAGGHRSAVLRRSAWRRQTDTVDVGRMSTCASAWFRSSTSNGSRSCIATRRSGVTRPRR